MQSFCWWCGSKLKLPFFKTVADQLGHQQKVHKCCVKDAQASIKPITADVTGIKPQQTDPFGCGG
jgi:hypothetical protein